MVFTSAKLRSRLTNGKTLLQEIDGRSAQARRFRDLFGLYVADLGGEDAGLSEGQLSLARRAACLTVELERLETVFAQNEGATDFQLATYQRTANSLRRLLESLGIARGRVARDVTPDLQTYLRTRRSRNIDHDTEDDAA
jgi:hypothetical protein